MGEGPGRKKTQTFRTLRETFWPAGCEGGKRLKVDRGGELSKIAEKRTRNGGSQKGGSRAELKSDMTKTK